MCDAPLPVPPEAYNKMPLAIDSDHPLFNVGKKELTAALRTPRENHWAADWLFRDLASTFHPNARALPPEAFGRSLAVHVHHDISTPGCPAPPIANLPLRHDASTAEDNRLVISKDIDLLLIPVAKVADVTAGYAFLRSVQGSSLRFATAGSFGASPSEQGFPNPEFITARFVFHHPRNDFLMVVPGQLSPMIGIVSMRWITPNTRDRSYFVVPSANYSAGNLPSRVLTVQCHVDHEISGTQPPPEQTEQPPQPPEPFLPPTMCGTAEEVAQGLADCTSCQTEEPPSTATHSPNANGAYSSGTPSVPSSAPGTSPAPDTSPSLPAASPDMSTGTLEKEPAPNGQSDDWLDLDSALPASLSDGLASIGTVLHPEDPDALLPTFLQDFVSTSMDLELDKILADDSPSGPVPPLPDASMDGMFEPPSPESSDTTPSEEPNGASNPSKSGSWDGSWLVNSARSTPDGVSAARRAGPSDTSSGAFDLSVLADSLSTIEQSLSGNFFGPKVRKDVMHPQTGELISRCTGELTGYVRSIDNKVIRMLREAAAQSYYSSSLSVNPDARLLSPPPQVASAARQAASRGVPTPGMSGMPLNSNVSSAQKGHPQTILRTASALAPSSSVSSASNVAPTAHLLAPSGPGLAANIAPAPGAPRVPPVQQGVAFKRARPTRLMPLPLAPRQMPLAVASRRPGDEVVLNAVPLPAGGVIDKDTSREARLEAKRIKNRMSAAKSNQKRRQQIEKQKQELDALRKRVEELQGKERTITEENHRLRAQVATQTS